MDKRDYIKRAIDATNAFGTFQSAATVVNPKIWDTRLREYEEKSLVLTPQAEQFDFTSPGSDYTVTIDGAPTAAALLTETVDITISALSNRQVTFTPKEYGKGFQLTRKEAVRAFFNVADNMTKKLGYSLAQLKDSLAYTCLLTATANTVLVNGKTAATAIASTDTLNYKAITQAIVNIEEDLYTPKKMFISHKQKQDLYNLESVHDASKFGTRDAVARGLIGELFGLEIFASHSITTTTTTGKTIQYAVVLGVTGMGEQAFGYAIKRPAIIEREYHARGRYWDIVAHEEYDFQLLHANAVALIGSYYSE